MLSQAAKCLNLITMFPVEKRMSAQVNETLLQFLQCLCLCVSAHMCLCALRASAHLHVNALD